MKEYLHSDQYPTKLAEIIQFNHKSNELEDGMEQSIPYLNSKDNIDDFKDDKSNWYNIGSHQINSKRVLLMKYFSKFSAKEHSEMINSNRYKEIMPIDVMKAILSKQEHVNFTTAESQLNYLLSLQGFILDNFINLWLKSDMKFLDTIDSNNIEYNNPFARQRIRVNNREKEACGKFFVDQVKIADWCEDLLEIFFPQVNFIWSDYHQFTHVSVLALVRWCFEYGFIEFERVEKIAELVLNAVQSLKKLEMAWKEKHTAELNNKRRDEAKFERLENKRLKMVADFQAQCKEHIASIITQMINLSYDHQFTKIFPAYIYKKLSFSSEEDEQKRMIDSVNRTFPFYQKSFNNSVLSVVMNYLSESSNLGPNLIINSKSRNAIEKAFMFVSTTERDCFITSMRQITSTDLKWFDVRLEEKSSLKIKAISFKANIIYLLDSIRNGGFDLEGNKIKPLGKATTEQQKDMESTLNVKKINTNKVSHDKNTIIGEKGIMHFNDGKNIVDIMENYINEIQELQGADPDFSWSQTRQSVPLLLQAVADYVSDMMEFEHYGKALTVIFKLIYTICKNNNLGKAQIFKGDGCFHLLNLVRRNNTQCIILLIQLTEELNIGAFVSKNLFVELSNHYGDLLDLVRSKWDSDKDDANYDASLLYTLLMMNRFFDNLFKRTFINERERMKNMLLLQQILFRVSSEVLIPSAIDILENEDMRQENPQNLIDKDKFKMGDEIDLIFHLELEKKTGGFSYHKRLQLKLNACTSTIRVLNKVSKSAFSRKVKEAMVGPMHKVREHLMKLDFNNKYPHTPAGKDAELIKLIRFYVVVPDANWLIDRKCDWQRTCVTQDDESEELINNLVAKAQQFLVKRPEDGQTYVLGGILPMIYKYVTGFYNLVNYSDKADIGRAISRMEAQLMTFNDHSETLAKLCEKNPKHFQWDRFVADVQMTISESAAKDKRELNEDLVKYCDCAMKNIEQYFEGFPQFQDLIQQYRQVSKTEYLNGKKTTRFKENISDPELKEKMRVLKALLNRYKLTKQNYIDSDTGTSLLSFFKRNKDNLHGVFESTIERLFGEQYGERESISENPVVNRFWVNPSTQYYIQLQEKLFSQGKFARSMFFDFMNERISKDDKKPKKIDKINMEDWDDDKLRGEFVDINRRKLMDVLLKVNSDILCFQMSKPTVNAIWWSINELYVMINAIVKNLSENNYLPFKRYCSTYVPKSAYDPHFNKERFNMTEYFREQMLYILRFSLISENRDTKMLHTDQHRRIIPLLQPLINMMNELVTGPCEENQNIILEAQYLGIYPVFTRIIDDLTSDFYELKLNLVTFMLSLSEGGNKNMLMRISRFIPSAAFEEIIMKLVKKLYMREMIKSGKLHEHIENTKAKGGFSRVVVGSFGVRSHVADSNGEVLGRDKHGLDKNFIPGKMEELMPIETWEDLFDLYKESRDFSDAQDFCEKAQVRNQNIFMTVFQTQILWKTIGKVSKIHKNRLREIQTQASEYFGEDDQVVSDEIVYKKAEKINPTMHSIFYFLKHVTARVEVVTEEKNQEVYFPLRPACWQMSPQVQKEFRDDVDITDSNSKMIALMKRFEVLKNGMEVELDLYRNSRFLYKIISEDSFYTYLLLQFFLGFVVNIILTVGLHGANGIWYFQSDALEIAIQIITIVQIVFAVICLMLYTFGRFPSKLLDKELEFRAENKTLDPNSAIWSAKITLIDAFLGNKFVFSMIWYIICGSFGIKLSPFFYSLELLMIININTTTANVLKSVYLHGNQLIWSLVLQVFIVYGYTAWIMTRFDNEMDPDSQITCKDFWICFTYLINYGLRNGGGIADSMVHFAAGGDLARYYEWFLISLSWFLLVNVIFLNIIFGIIIDTFGELRDEQRARNEDQDDICFVCGKTRGEFAKQNREFDTHIEEEHLLWDYVYFLYYLQEKGIGDLNGIESRAWEGFNRQKCDWIPIGSTKYLKEDEAADQINDLFEDVMNVKRWMKAFDRKIADEYGTKPIGMKKNTFELRRQTTQDDINAGEMQAGGGVNE